MVATIHTHTHFFIFFVDGSQKLRMVSLLAFSLSPSSFKFQEALPAPFTFPLPGFPVLVPRQWPVPAARRVPAYQLSGRRAAIAGVVLRDR